MMISKSGLIGMMSKYVSGLSPKSRSSVCLSTDLFMNVRLLPSFEVRIRVSLSVDGSLALTSRVRNVNGKPFSFSFAYHTYFSVSDIR